MDEEIQEVRSSFDELRQDISLNSSDFADIIESPGDVESTQPSPEENPEENAPSNEADSEGSLKDA